MYFHCVSFGWRDFLELSEEGIWSPPRSSVSLSLMYFLKAIGMFLMDI